MKITLVQITSGLANLALHADNQAEKDTLRGLFESGFCSSSTKARGDFTGVTIGVIKPDAMKTLEAMSETLRMVTAAGAQLSEIVAFSSATPRPEPAPPPDDGHYTTGHKVPACNECGLDLHLEGDQRKCGQCEKTFGQALRMILTGNREKGGKAD